MNKKRDYYEILGVSRDAEDAAIRKAYRKLAKKYHPDSNSGNAAAEDKFKEISEAYKILSDPEKRKLYDRFGHAAFEGGAATEEAYRRAYENGENGNFNGTGFDGFHGFGQNDQGGYQEYHFTGGSGNMDDILKNLFGHGAGGARSGFEGFSFGAGNGFDSGFDSGFAGGFQGSAPQKGANLTAQVELSFEEAAFGAKKRIRLQDENGRVTSLEINVPAGIESGKAIRLKGKGQTGAAGNGDLLLTVQVKEKPGWHREGMDVYNTVSIPFTTAVFGGDAAVDTIYGKVLCKIKKGTQSGSKIRLKGKGVVSMKNKNVYGDQYTTIAIEVPRDLTPEAAKKLREYEQICKNSGHGFHHGSAA